MICVFFSQSEPANYSIKPAHTILVKWNIVVNVYYLNIQCESPGNASIDCGKIINKKKLIILQYTKVDADNSAKIFSNGGTSSYTGSRC